jgi:cytochrome c oxidase subunit 4
MSGHGEEAIKKSIRTYMVVFVSLAALTVLTVAVSYVELSTGMGILVALIIASVKASLVAAFFMHLIDERQAIYSILLLTAVFFVVLIFVPIATFADHLGG